jgi:phosphoribosylanthranilate isomerase
MMDVKVKICGITSVEDALAALEADADILGFVLAEQSPRRVSIETAREIARQLPPTAMRVGVFVNAKVERVMFALRICDFGGLQFHGEEPPAYCQQFGVPTIKAFRIRDQESLRAMSSYDTDYYLLDSYLAGQPGGTGETFNWNLAVEARGLGKPVILAGGLTPQNVAEAVRKVQPFGVDVSTGVESAPGKKDRQKMRDFVAAVRGAG